MFSKKVDEAEYSQPSSWATLYFCADKTVIWFKINNAQTSTIQKSFLLTFFPPFKFSFKYMARKDKTTAVNAKGILMATALLSSTLFLPVLDILIENALSSGLRESHAGNLSPYFKVLTVIFLLLNTT